MHFHHLYLCVCLFLAPVISFCQTVKQTDVFAQTWLGYNNQTRFSNRWGLWFDAQLYTKQNMVKGLFQSEIRPGIMYYVNNNTKLAVGYTHLNNFPGDNHKNISQPEHRTWQQVQWHNNYPRTNTMQWFRLEQRWVRKVANDSTLAPGSNFTNRVRYNFLLNVPIYSQQKQTPVAATINNEIFVNFGKNVVYNYFDQNRFFAGVTYKFSANNNLQAGYLNIFQQLAVGNKYRMLHALRVNYFHNLDLRKKDGVAK
jgi:hypothetical protein